MSNFIKIDIKTIIIIILASILILEKCQDDDKNQETVTIDGKKYGLLKYSIDTFEIYKTSYGYKKGDDIHHDVYHLDTAYLPAEIDTLQILKDFFAKYVYNDTLELNDSLGFVYILDTISKNKLYSRTWSTSVKEKTIRETTIVKDLPKIEYYFGMNANLDKVDYLNSLGTSLIIKNRKDNLYQLNLGIANKQPLNSNTQFTPYFGGGIYWKIK